MQASPGIKPAPPWQCLRGEWLGPFNITGCSVKLPQSLRLVGQPLRALAGLHNPRYVLRPYVPAKTFVRLRA